MRKTLSGLCCSILLAGFVLVYSTSPAFAYVDPGSGSMILQGLVATLAAGLATIRIYWRKLKSLFTGKQSETTSSQEGSQDS